MGLTSRFKTDAEQIAEDIRDELNIENIVAIDPFALLEHLGVPAITLTQLCEINNGADPLLEQAVDFLRSPSGGGLSAATVFGGNQRIVVYNDAHSLERRNSDLCHEASHALLLHPPAPAMDAHGCRAWNKQIEDEAQHLAGALLVPGKAARYAAIAGWSHERMSSEFGCSVDLARWRDNVAGGLRIRRKRAGAGRREAQGPPT